MAKGCGPNCARLILIVFNTIFWLSGAALLALGIYLLVNTKVNANIEFLSMVDDVFQDSSNSLIKVAAYALIAVGCFIIIVGFCGCFGAIKENKCLLGLYIFFLVIVMLCEGGIAGISIYFKQEILKAATDTFKNEVAANYSTDATIREVVNTVQMEFECCGWSGVADYADVTFADSASESKSGVVPTCCAVTVPEGTNNGEITWAMNAADCTVTANQFASCQSKLTDWINQYSFILIGVGIGIACLELFGIIFACCLCRNVEED